MFRSVLATVSVLAGASAAHAVGYTRVLDFDTLNGEGSTNRLYAVVPYDDGFYSFVTDFTSPRVTHTVASGSGWSTTELLPADVWTDAGGSKTGFVYYGLGISGNYLQMVDTTTSEAIWRIDRTTGGLSQYVTQAQVSTYISGATGEDLTANLTTSHTVAPNGEHVFFESKSGYMLRTIGSGSLATVFTATQLSNDTGGTDISGGLTVDNSGRLLFGLDTGDPENNSVWAFDESAGTFTELVTGNAILSLTGGTDITFNDLFYAPDGWVYFQDNVTDHILGFDLDDASTLSIIVNAADLNDDAGVGSGILGQLSWYQGNLAWNTAGTASGTHQGFYAIPEPASLALLGVSGLLVFRRRGH